MPNKVYYSDDWVTIYHGDNRDVSVEQCDHLITDPPYSAVTHKGARTGSGQDVLLENKFSETTSDAIRGMLLRFSPRRWSLFFGDHYTVAPISLDPPSHLEFIRWMVWVKPNGAPQFTGDRPATGLEHIALLHPPGKKEWNGGGKHGVYTCNQAANPHHPTVKPQKLMLQLVSDFTDNGETVIDPFMGIGSTLLACKTLGRKCIGIELEEKYCEVAAKRLSQDYFDFDQ